MEIPAHVHLDAVLQQGDVAASSDECLGQHHHPAIVLQKERKYHCDMEELNYLFGDTEGQFN